MSIFIIIAALHQSHIICIVDADILLSGNKLVSGIHCCMERDDNGRIWLVDTR